MKSRNVYIICCEGEAEEYIFAYLRSRFCRNKITFKVENFKGIDGFETFVSRYSDVLKKYKFGKRKTEQNLHFFFLIDGDLDDTPNIISYIEAEEHAYQIMKENTETVLLRLAGVSVVVDVPLPDFRRKAKKKFVEKFGKEAHKIKDKELDTFINEEKFLKNFPDLALLFKS